jgi:Ca2+-binding RTX toxin-like protein
MATPVPIVLMIGQSNMRLSAVANAAAENVAGKGGMVVHHAVSGSPLSANLDTGPGDWSGADNPEAGEHLDDLRFKIDALITPGSPAYIPGAYVAGAVWVQGEADAATDASSEAYAENLTELRDVLVEEYGEHDWAIAALSGQVWDFRTKGFNREPFWNAVRSSQIELDEGPGFQTVDTDALANELGYTPQDMFQDDYVHYEDGFGAELGNTLANKLDFEGEATLQVGTAGKDYFYSHTEGPGQILGSQGHDTADFSELDHAIRLNVYGRGLASVHGKGAPPGYKVNLVEVEKVIGTDHDDVFRLGTLNRDVRGGGGDDKAFGTGAPDVIRGGDGNDVAVGRGGNDALIGGRGDDRLFGQDGNDRLYGGADDDFINAGSGDDYIVGGNGDDEIRLGKGADQVVYHRGNNGSDEIQGFSTKDDVLSFEGTGASIEDLFLSVEDSNLRIELEMETAKADILILNGARYMPDENEEDPLDWIHF